MRCFIAIELPTGVRDRLVALQTSLRELDSQIRWTRPEHVHVTLKFLGDVPDTQVTDICRTAIETAARLPPIGVEVAGAGCFPPGGPVRIVWVGVIGPSPELTACHAACEEAFARLGYLPETRPFRPHLTIGRSRDPKGARQVRETVAANGDFRCGRFTATELAVIQSVLGRSGPTYTRLARAPLAGR
ncbi:MAG: RNA 2',3'-cyclic phosphodiesterase [Planctomycetes bacterium]|nr:RNA 2',3'-cyclic phosphodiesterase [Planctomycetota bacterium]